MEGESDEKGMSIHVMIYDFDLDMVSGMNMAALAFTRMFVQY